jgi:hypothetical protein
LVDRRNRSRRSWQHEHRAFVGALDHAADFGTGVVRFAGATDAMIVMLDTAQ